MNCWHSDREDHSVNCPYKLSRVEVTHYLPEVSFNDKNQTVPWALQFVKHIYSFWSDPQGTPEG